MFIQFVKCENISNICKVKFSIEFSNEIEFYYIKPKWHKIPDRWYYKLFAWILFYSFLSSYRFKKTSYSFQSSKHIFLSKVFKIRIKNKTYNDGFRYVQFLSVILLLSGVFSRVFLYCHHVRSRFPRVAISTHLKLRQWLRQ